MSDNKQNTFSRREFGKQTAMGATALTGFSILNPAFAAEKNAPMKIGLIGAGGRGTGAVQDAIKASSNVQLIAIHDAYEDRAKGCLRRLQRNENLKENIKVDEDHIFTGLDSYKDLVRLDLDYVCIASPPGFKAEQFEAAVDHNKNVFCEKPVSTDPVSTRRYIAAAKKSEKMKLSVVTGTQRRHQKPYVETIKKIHDGILGEVLFGRAYWNGSLPWTRDRQEGMSDAEYQIRNWYQFCWICGDNIVEQHVHNIDVMNWVFGSHPISVIASGGRCWKPKIEKYGNIWDNFSCDFEYPNNVHVMSYCRHLNRCYNEVSEFVMGSKGKHSNCNDMGSGGINPYVQEHIDLQASILGTGPYLNEGVQVAESTFTAIFGRMAAYTGQKLMWDQALNMDLDLLPKDLSDSAKLPWDNIPVPGSRA